MTGNPARMQPAQILASLHEKFATNIASLPSEVGSCLEDIDDILRAIDVLRETQTRISKVSAHHERMQELLDEIFSDLTIAMYLICCGLFVPARMSARRALEVAIALLVMWDNPVLYFGWKADIEDLTFKGLLSTATSASYRSFITTIRDPSPEELDTTKYQQIYRKLSNTVHGKSADFAPVGPQRYSCDEKSRLGEARLLRDSAQLTLKALSYRLPKDV